MEHMDIKKIDRIAAGIILVLIVFAYFVFFRDGSTKVAVLMENEKMLMENVNAPYDINSELDRLGREIEDIQNNLDNFERQLPQKKHTYDFMAEIDALAGKNGVALKTIRPGKAEEGALYARLPIRISGSSDFGSFYRFLYQLENMPRITTMDHLRIKKGAKGQKCDIEMDLAVFVGGKKI